MKTDPEQSALFQFLTTGRIDLVGAWAGWTIRGKVLKTPDRLTVSVDQLAMLIYFDRQRQRREQQLVLQGARSAVIVEFGKRVEAMRIAGCAN